VARIEGGTLTALCSGSPMGLAGPAAMGWSGLGRAQGSTQTEGKGLLFSEFNFNAKIILEKSRNCFKGTKNTQKISKIPGKFLEID
jgi:hypothetical protein